MVHVTLVGFVAGVAHAEDKKSSIWGCGECVGLLSEGVLSYYFWGGPEEPLRVQSDPVDVCREEKFSCWTGWIFQRDVSLAAEFSFRQILASEDWGFSSHQDHPCDVCLTIFLHKSHIYTQKFLRRTPNLNCLGRFQIFKQQCSWIDVWALPTGLNMQRSVRSGVQKANVFSNLVWETPFSFRVSSIELLGYLNETLR